MVGVAFLGWYTLTLYQTKDTSHTFAVTTLLGWYREGADVPGLLPRLSTYLGHSNPANTYWYMTAIPELLAYAAGLLERAPQNLKEALS